MNTTRKIIGWREWVTLPDLNIPFIKAKVDTGARTSALHAFELETFTDNGVAMVRFGLHPLQKNDEVQIYCTAPVVDERVVSDSGGHKEKRTVIMTPIQMGGETWPIELTLTNRDTMRFRMLLGRTGLGQRFSIEADASYQMGRPTTKLLSKAYGIKEE